MQRYFDNLTPIASERKYSDSSGTGKAMPPERRDGLGLSGAKTAA
jgi:hypothetical protein